MARRTVRDLEAGLGEEAADGAETEADMGLFCVKIYLTKVNKEAGQYIGWKRRILRSEVATIELF